MRFYKILPLLIYWLIVPVMCAENIPAILHFPGPAPLSADLLQLNWDFDGLRIQANQKHTNDLISATERLSDTILMPIEFDDVEDQKPLLKQLRVIRNSLKTADDIMLPIIRELKEIIRNRIDLARIDQNIKTKKGRKGTFNHPNFSPNVINALKHLTGIIFCIKITLTGRILKKTVQSVGSGMLIHIPPGDIRVPAIPTLVPGVSGRGVELNAVLTCAHVLTMKDDEFRELYFVPSSVLDLRHGLPSALSGIPDANMDSLIQFLRNNRSSYRIKDFTLWQNRQGSPPAIGTNNSLNFSTPMYLMNEDMVIAKITPNQEAALPQYQNAVGINYLVGVDAIANASAEGKYFALGYPGCDHYDTDSIVGGFNFLKSELGLSPLFITKAYATPQKPIRLIAEQILHRAPAAAGMSGGPLFTVNADTISVLGVITQGEDNKELACQLR